LETLRLRLDRKGRSGRTVTVVEGFIRGSRELDGLCRDIKRTHGTGGNCRGASLEIQGDARSFLKGYLTTAGFQVKT
jgi:translation initiation factor 1